jgi:hypothetical protein
MCHLHKELISGANQAFNKGLCRLKSTEPQILIAEPMIALTDPGRRTNLNLSLTSLILIDLLKL